MSVCIVIPVHSVLHCVFLAIAVYFVLHLQNQCYTCELSVVCLGTQCCTCGSVLCTCMPSAFSGTDVQVLSLDARHISALKWLDVLP